MVPFLKGSTLLLTLRIH